MMAMDGVLTFLLIASIVSVWLVLYYMKPDFVMKHDAQGVATLDMQKYLVYSSLISLGSVFILLGIRWWINKGMLGR